MIYHTLVILVAICWGCTGISRMALERCGLLRLLDVSAMLPIRAHFEEDYGHWLRSSQREGEDTIRRCWSPTEQDARTCTSQSALWTVKRMEWGFFRLRKRCPSGMGKTGKINANNKFSAANLRKVHIAHPCLTISKIILVTVMDNPLSESQQLTDKL